MEEISQSSLLGSSSEKNDMYMTNQSQLIDNVDVTRRRR